MKTKVLILIAFSALISLSFAFRTKDKLHSRSNPSEVSPKAKIESVGFISEDKM